MIHIQLVELKLICRPNVVGKPQLGYDFEAMEKYLTLIFKLVQRFENVNNEMNSYYENILIGIKLPPYFDISHFISSEYLHALID